MKSFFSWPIRRHLFLLVLLGVLPALGIILYSGLETRRHMRSDAERNLTGLLDTLAAGQENLVDRTRTLFETLSDVPAVRARDSRACNSLFASLLLRNPRYVNILAADPRGNIFASATPIGQINAADRKYFREAVATGAFSAGEYAVSRSTGKSSLHFAHPVHDNTGALRAVVLAALDIDQFRTVVTRTQLPRNSVFVVTDHAGVVLHDSRAASLSGRLAREEKLLAALKGPADGGLFNAVSADRIRRLFAFRRLRLSPDRSPYLLLAVGIPESEIYALPDTLLTRNLLLLGVAGLFAVAAAWILGNAAIVDRVKDLVGAAQRFGKGDLAARANLPRAEGEIGLLARSFDEMAESIAARARSQRAAEEALRESEERYRSLFHDSPAVMLLIDPDTGAIADANAAACRYYGFPREEFREMKVAEIDTVPSGQVLENLQLALSEKRNHFVLSHRLASGEARPVEVFIGPVTAHGKTFLHSIVHDISLRQRALEALQLSEERYRLVVENASDVIFVAQDGFVKFPNPRPTEVTGYSQQELTRVPFPAFIHPDDREMVVDRYRKRLAGENVPARYSFRLLTKSGEVLWMDISSVLITWEGRPATLNFLRDITLQKKLEAQLLHAQKMEAVGTLAGGIAHDFNNLLQAITGFAALALIGLPDGDDRVRANVRNIVKAADRATALVRRLLAFSRQDGASPHRLVDLNVEVFHTAEILERTIPKMIRIETRLAKDLHPVLAEPVQIEQVIMNLATNARDAMPDGGVLRIETENRIVDADDARRPAGGASGPCVVLRVSDNGIGMDAETKAKMFDPFFTTKGVGAGTGLGLSTIYGIVLGHGGWIHCDSEPGRGTCFEIVFPAAGEMLRAPAEEARAGPDPPRGSGTILFVDDEEMIRSLGKSIFESDGYAVVLAESGEKAIELFVAGTGRFDLVILDLGMPGMGGRKCLDALRRIDPAARILVASGYSEAQRGPEILDAGAAGFVSKPYTSQEILRAARTILGAGPKA